jgi:hypothetical protein
VLFSCLSFSSGIPILYLLGSINFVVMYAYYKWMLLKWYQKTSEFNQDFVISAVNIMKFGIVLHMLFGIFIYSPVYILKTDE